MHKYLFFLLSLFILTNTIARGQQLLYNYDFEESGGSLDGWTTTSGTELRDRDGDHFAYLSGENGVLLQEVDAITPGKVYQCEIYFNYLFVKQTTGYGFALEFDSDLVLPSFTKGATDLRSFCNNNAGDWTQLPDSYTGNSVVESFIISTPADAGTLYICLGTKGALAKYEVDSVKLFEVAATEVMFTVKDKVTGGSIRSAEIYMDGSSNPFFSDAEGKASVGLVPGEHRVEVAANWYQYYEQTFTVNNTPIQLELLLDSVVHVKDVETRISKYSDNATPYPMFGHFWTDGLGFTNAEVDTLVATLDYMIGGSGVSRSSTVQDRLHTADPGFQVIKYSGGWSINASNAEKDKMNLQYYRCGALGKNISATDTVFFMNAPPDNKGLGLVPSEPGNFTTWIRIGDELMKIVSVNRSTVYPIIVEVERGFDKTEPMAHSMNDNVTAPLYSAPPNPGGDNGNLSYFSTVWGPRKSVIWENTVNNTIGDHTDGVWIDILVGWLGANNMVGGNYTLWNHEKDQVFSNEDIIKRTKDAIQEIAIRFYSRLGYMPVIYGNNVLYDQEFNSGSRGYMMVGNETHTEVIDGFCHENSWGHMSDNSGNIDNDGDPIHTADKFITVGENGHYLEWIMGDTWIRNSKSIALLAQRGLPNQPMTINAGFKNQWFAADLTSQVRYNFHKYCYVSYLLAVDVDQDSLISCRLGISPQVKQGGAVTIDFQPFFYYDIGIPVENHSYSDFENYRLGDHNLFARKFSNGLVLLNPFRENMDQPVSIDDISGDLYTYLDAESGSDSIPIENVQLASRQAMILLRGELQQEDTTNMKISVVNSLTLYPMPAADQVTIEVTDDINGKIGVEVISLSGRSSIIEVEFVGGRGILDTSPFTEGMYLVRIERIAGVQKLIISR